MRFFLSYASDNDKVPAAEIKKGLEELDPSHPHEVLIDYESLKKAQDTDDQINRLLEGCDALLYLITVSSIRSFWCGKEVGYAQCLGKPIVPIAGPGITGDFIKSQSVPWISGLKWVNWWERDRARKIVEALEEENSILRMFTLPREGVPGVKVPKDTIVVAFHNSRGISVTDVSIAIELRIEIDGGGVVFSERSPNMFLFIAPGESVRSALPLSGFRRPSATLSREWLVDGLKARKFGIHQCKALVLVKYCIGGQHYISRLFNAPLADLCSPDLREDLMKVD